MILESIVTSVNEQGEVNIAPMGPTVDPLLDTITLRPFRSSRTYKNLMATGQAVVHVCDDVMLLARAAMDAIEIEEATELTVPLDASTSRRLVDCHRWFQVETNIVEEDERRATMSCRIIESATVRPFFGFNRAKFAVLEAAILGTRTHLISQTEIRESMKKLKVLVEKTGGDQEHAAFDFLSQAIDLRYTHR